MNTEQKTTLPASILVDRQRLKFGPKIFTEDGETYRIIAEVRHDDSCKNGHNTFSITGTIDRKSANGIWCYDRGGCIHDEIAKHFPKLAPLLKWHLTSTDGPMHYLANTIYHASERDYNGLLAGEFRQHTSRGTQNHGIPGVPCWELKLPEGTNREIYADEKPAPIIAEYQPYGRTGEGKPRELDAARSCAVWPDATDEELVAPDLKRRLIERFPALMLEFKADVESLGLVY